MFKFKTKDIKRVITILGNVNPYKTLPVLRDILVRPYGEFAEFLRTDLEIVIGVTVKLEEPVEDEKPFILPGATVGKFISNLDSVLEVSVGEGMHTISIADVGEFTCKAIPATDYPEIHARKEFEGSKFELDPVFIPHLDIIKDAAATEDSRPVLRGVLVKGNALVGADGFRLHVMDSDIFAFPDDTPRIIPLSSCYALCKIFKGKEPLQCSASDTEISFTQGDVSMPTRIIMGNYPDYTKLIPESFTSKIDLSSPLFLSRLNMMPNPVMTRLSFHDEVCDITAAFESEEAKYNLKLPVKCQGYSKIAVNQNYLKSALRKLSMATLELSTTTQPLKITGDIPGFTAVVMPMFAQW